MSPSTSANTARQRTLVLGGAGFLGGHIVDALQAAGHRVRVFDRSPRRSLPTTTVDCEWVEGDFGNRGDLSGAIDGCDAAVHLVATTLPKTSNDDPVHDIESNVLPTLRFLDLARKGGVRRIIFASSGGTVYGPPETVPIPETHATRPLCSYGIHKLTIERYLELYRVLYGLEYCVLRLANPFGERQRPDGSQGAVAVFLDKALRGEEISVWGDGSAIRDYIYVEDVAQAFCRALEHPEPAGTFNIGSGRGQSVKELLAAISTLLQRPVPHRYVDARAFDVAVNVLDIRLAARTLGWQPRVPFLEGLERTLAWRRRLLADALP
jgi:UDP-glucose 4-epimerase